MPDSSKELLQRVFQAMPSDQRLTFLQEILVSLNPQDRQTVIDAAANPGNHFPAPESSPHSAPTPAPSAFPQPTAPAPTQAEMSDEERAKLIDAEMKKLTLTSQERPSSYWGQLFRLGLWLAAALFILISLSVGGKELIDLIKDALFSD